MSRPPRRSLRSRRKHAESRPTSTSRTSPGAAAVASRAMEQIVTSTPGFAKDENGRFTSRERTARVNTSSTANDLRPDRRHVLESIDPGHRAGIEIIYGQRAGEFGEKVGAVIKPDDEVRSGRRRAKDGCVCWCLEILHRRKRVCPVGGGSQTIRLLRNR